VEGVGVRRLSRYITADAIGMAVDRFLFSTAIPGRTSKVNEDERCIYFYYPQLS
jgi:hypothetical protein